MEILFITPRSNETRSRGNINNYRAKLRLIMVIILINVLPAAPIDSKSDVHVHPNGPGSLGFEERLVIDLLNRSSLTVRPNACIIHCSKPVVVNVTYNVIQILAFSQAEETLSISGWFTLVWRDHRLRWKKSAYGNVSQATLASKHLWLPDLGMMNGKNSNDFDFSSTAQSRLNIDSDGLVTWLHGIILHVTCPLDVRYFPFDLQTCYLILTPWQSHIQNLQIKPVQHGSAVDNSYLPNSNVSEWVINSVHFKRHLYKSQSNVSYQYINISLELQRQPLYFIVLVLIPFSMLSCLACLIFTLEDTGDRLSVALSLVLSMTMYVVIVSSNAPRSMRTLPVLGIYLLDQLGLLSVATVMAVVNNKMRCYRSSSHHANGGPSSSFRCPDTVDDSPILELRKMTQLSHVNNSVHDQYIPMDSLPNNKKSSKGSKKSRKPRDPYIYRKTAVFLDHFELVFYLFLSAVNAVVCLFILPQMQYTN